jgi:hypothetical protein
MMEWVLADLDFADLYIDDITVGSTGNSVDELLENHYNDVRRVLNVLQKNTLVCSPKKSHFFMRQVEFCGHILREGTRSPAPGKLMPIQQWQTPKIVTELRGFLGLCNYFSEYVDHYADAAGPLCEKLKLSREDGKKRSQKAIEWTPEDLQAFDLLNSKLAKYLELYQLDPDRPFILRCDASHYAIGAVLEQAHPDDVGGGPIDIGKTLLVPVSFFSRNLTGSQLNWTPREKETYAIVASLRKWAGHIGFQPVIVVTDHRSLQHWVTENVDTPSGPRGRRARWHETLSQFDLEVIYVPGPTNIVADALSRYAYPATSSREDVGSYGSEQARLEVKKMVEQEMRERALVAVVRRGEGGILGCFAVGGPAQVSRPFAGHVRVATRSGKVAEPSPEPVRPLAPVAPPITPSAPQVDIPHPGSP